MLYMFLAPGELEYENFMTDLKAYMLSIKKKDHFVLPELYFSISKLSILIRA